MHGPSSDSSLALLTDLYQLTMAQGYWKLGRAERIAAFHLSFRKPPFASGYTVVAGVQPALDFIERFRFDTSDLDYLQTLVGNDQQPLFATDFLDYLAKLRLTCDVDAMREGTVAFAHEPLLRVVGPILQCQILETAILNFVNFQTLVATKAARICSATAGQPVLEFGLRRAQGIDGGLSASRAAFVGGCAATSNVLAGKIHGIPVKGSHSHSWVMSFATEQESFEAYAEAMPNNCVFLVDTYDTIDGVHRAVAVGRKLRESGHQMVGIRLDSGDLAYLSMEARKILDEAGFDDAAIVASNDLDEKIIESLKSQGAQISVWGVGTKLATAYDQPALGGVYKLGAMHDYDGNWQPKVKLSEQAIKTSVPGVLQVRRIQSEDGFAQDVVYEQSLGVDPRATMVDSMNAMRRKRIPAGSHCDLLQPAIRTGGRVQAAESLVDLQQRARDEIQQLHPSIRRFMNPHEYPVGLDIGLHELRERMILEARESEG